MHKKVCEKIFVELKWHQKKKKMLEFKPYMISDTIPYIIYADLECLIKKIEGCANNPEKSSTTEIGEHIQWIFLLDIQCQQSGALVM